MAVNVKKLTRVLSALTPSRLIDVGERIEQDRKALGLTAATFAALLQISERQYRRMHRTSADITSDMLLKICVVTGRDPNYFLLPRGGDVTQAAQLVPHRLRRLLALPPWALQTVNLLIMELEKQCRRKK